LSVEKSEVLKFLECVSPSTSPRHWEFVECRKVQSVEVLGVQEFLESRSSWSLEALGVWDMAGPPAPNTKATQFTPASSTERFLPLKEVWNEVGKRRKKERKFTFRLLIVLIKLLWG
jgi:hypothetical protein